MYFFREKIPALEANIAETGTKILSLETKLERLKSDLGKAQVCLFYLFFLPCINFFYQFEPICLK